MMLHPDRDSEMAQKLGYGDVIARKDIKGFSADLQSSYWAPGASKGVYVSKKCHVNGEQAHPLWKFLKHVMPDTRGNEHILWDFTKFLVDRSGEVRKRTGPMSSLASMEKKIVELLEETELEAAHRAGRLVKSGRGDRDRSDAESTRSGSSLYTTGSLDGERIEQELVNADRKAGEDPMDSEDEHVDNDAIRKAFAERQAQAQKTAAGKGKKKSGKK